jgi:hypothetical protein
MHFNYNYVFVRRCRYVVTINGAVHKKHLIAISEGTIIDGVKCVPDLVEPLIAQSDTKKIRIKIVVIFFSSPLFYYIPQDFAWLVYLSNVLYNYVEYRKFDMNHLGQKYILVTYALASLGAVLCSSMKLLFFLSGDRKGSVITW